MTGGATSGSPTLALATCGNGQILKSTGSGWSCATDDGTTYTAGQGLNLAAGQFTAAFTAPGGDNGTAALVARGDHLHEARYARKPFSTVVVSPSGTPAQNGAALLAALAGITDNSASKPYLIKLEPGIYDVGAVAYVGKPYVDLEGSGREVTTVQGAPTSSVVSMEARSEVRELSIVHGGGTADANALGLTLNPGGLTAARRVRISSSGGTSNTVGLFTTGTGTALLEDSELTVTGTSGLGMGIRALNAGNLIISRSRVTGTANGLVAGIYATGASVDASQSVFKVSGSALTTLGIYYAHPSGRMTLQDVTVEAAGAATGGTPAVYALQLEAPSVKIEGGSFTASQTGNPNGSATAATLFNTSFIARGSQFSATSTGSVVGLYLAAGNGAYVSRIDSSRVIAAQAFTVTGGAGTMTLSVAATQVAATAPSVVLTGGTLRCVYAYDENDAPLGANCN
mgnify:CR=1 FL=1